MAKDSRLTGIEQDRDEQLNEIDQKFGEMVSNSDQYYNQQIEASKENAAQQQQIQQEKTDFEIQQIEQQKETAQQSYTKEQSGAYADWQKQSNRYGVNAEQMAAAGLSRTGFSESAQVSMYNTYQNRVATARSAFSQAVTNYDNAMTNARLQNNALLAEIAAAALKEQAELSLQAFQYKNSLLLQQESEKRAWTGIFDTRYAQMLDQINTERALAEQRRQANLAHSRWEQEQAFAREQYEAQQAQQQTYLNALYGDTTKANILDFTYKGNTASSMQSTISNIGSYSDAVNALRSNGLSGSVGGLYTRQEYINHGYAASMYDQYLQAYVANASVGRKQSAWISQFRIK